MGLLMLIPMETYIICDFPGGGGVQTPCTLPLDPPMYDQAIPQPQITDQSVAPRERHQKTDKNC